MIGKEKIEDFCRRWKISEFSLFGSVLRGDFRPDSDVDVLVSFAPDIPWSLFDWIEQYRDKFTILPIWQRKAKAQTFGGIPESWRSPQQ
uniref:Nucleotidyltransferase n=1 Tax=Desulfobacca acetoxidans TaxID=60893 RepID=A0A7V6DP99_9BACT